MRKNWFYFFVPVLLIVMIWVSQRFFTGSVHASVGVTAARQYQISVDQPAQVKRVAVVAGQQVKAGDLLIVVESSLLQMELEKLSSRIGTLRSELTEKNKLAHSEIAYAQAETQVQLEEINTEIRLKENELALNAALQVAPLEKTKTLSPMEEAVHSLKEQRKRLEEALTIRMKEIQQRNDLETIVLRNQVSLLEHEGELLEIQRKNLSKYAATGGTVENVLVKEGEEVEAYRSLITISPEHPASVVGYMVGRKDQLTIGSKVTVRSYNNRQVRMEGRVIGYGAMVPLPDILQASTAVRAFGQEIFIEIDADNGFATGEKVLIR